MTEWVGYILELALCLVICAGAVLAWFSTKIRWLSWIFIGILWLTFLGTLLFMALSLFGAKLLYSGLPGFQLKMLLLIFGNLFTLCLSVCILIPPLRRFLFQWFPATPTSPLHVYGAYLLVLLSNYCLSNLILYNPNQMIASLSSTTPLASFTVTSVMLLALSFTGAGLFYKRKWSETFSRLGIAKPTGEQCRNTLILAVLLVGVIWGISEWVIRPFFPEEYTHTSKVLSSILPGETVSHRFIWAGVLALNAGITEELAFRGLLQPVLGIIPTSLLFLLIHYYYGPTPVLMFLFILSLVFAWLRERYNTSTAIMAHVTYDFLVMGLFLLNQ